MSNPAALGGSWRRIGRGEDSDTLGGCNEGLMSIWMVVMRGLMSKGVNEEVNDDETLVIQQFSVLALKGSLYPWFFFHNSTRTFEI